MDGAHLRPGAFGRLLVTLMGLWIAMAGPALAACPYPLGGALAGGQYATWGGGLDPEWQVVEANQLPGQTGNGLLVEGAGGLHLLYDSEMEVLLPGGVEGETHTVLYKRWSPEFGWDTRFLSLASDMVLQYVPDGRALAPAAAAVGDNVWAAWEVSGAQRYRHNGSYIALRGIYPDRFGPIMQVAYMDEDTANKLPAISDVGGTAYLGFQTNAGQVDRAEFHLAGRTWDGASLGPLEEISRPADGWSDVTVALASDGTRVFAAWASQRTQDIAGQGNWIIKAAVREPGGPWGPEFNLTTPRGARAERPAVSWNDGRLYVAWSTNDPALSAHGQFVIALQALDPRRGPLDLPAAAYDGGVGSNSHHVALRAWGGRLHLLWTSDAAPPSAHSSGADFDIYYANYTTADRLSPPRAVSDPADTEFVDALPGFFTYAGGLYANFVTNICRPGCGRETDWREMTRLLERPARWYDGLSANYYLEDPRMDPTTFVLTFFDAAGRPVASPDYFARTWNGSWIRAASNDSSIRGQVGANITTLRLVEAAYCGKLVATSQVSPPPGTPSAPYALWGALALGGVAAAALFGHWGRRAAPVRSTENSKKE